MESRIDILIDGSGSMGREVINGEQFLLPDGSSRMDLVKKILEFNLQPLLIDVDELVIQIFRTKLKRSHNGDYLKSENGKYLIKEGFSDVVYKVDKYDSKSFSETLANMHDPDLAGTPLYQILKHTYTNSPDQVQQIIIITDGDANDEVDFDIKMVKEIEKLKYDIPFHFIGISQSNEAEKKCKSISTASNGSYVNIQAINYDEKALNKKLFTIKSKITQNSLESVSKPDSNIKTTNEDNLRETVNPLEKTKEDSDITDEEAKNNSVSFETRDQYDLTRKVDDNSKALKQISIQLQNIVDFLQGSKGVEEITIYENPEHNQKIGRVAELILFEKLKSFDWKKVEWVNENEESYNSFDFITSHKQEDVYYECKGTSSDLNSFHLTGQEWEFYVANRGKYRLCFVQHVDGNPVIYRFMDLLNDIEEGRLKLYHSSNHKVKAGSITFFVDESMCDKF